MDMFGNHNVEHTVQGAADGSGVDFTVTDAYSEKKLPEMPCHPHDSLLDCRGEQHSAEANSETFETTESLTVGQVHVSGERTEKPNSLTPGLQRDTDTERELLNSNLPTTNNPCASRLSAVCGGPDGADAGEGYVRNSKF